MNDKWMQRDWEYVKTKTVEMVDISINNQFEYNQLEELTERVYGELKMLEHLLNMIDYSEPKASNFLQRMQQRSLQLQKMLEAYTDREMILVKQRAAKELS